MTGMYRDAPVTGRTGTHPGRRLVPATQEAPFQYRTYPGMEGSG